MQRLCPFLIASFLVGACARGESVEDRSVTSMREALDRATKQNEELEKKLTEQTLPPLPPKKTQAPETPKLRVVRIAPEEGENAALQPTTEPKATETASTDPEDASPRPVVRVIGIPGTRRTSRSDAIDVADPEGAPTPIQSSNLGRPSALDPAARRAYDDALSMVYAKKYDTALDAFASFLMRWPDHPNADNAHYWRGECYFGKGEFARAEEQFEGVLRQFPMGNKVADSLLKLSIVQEKLGKSAEAKQHRERLLRDYPKSDAAKRVSTP